MSALDDRYDVLDWIKKLGLDPDRISHLDIARKAMSDDANERYEREHPMTPERAEREQAARERNAKQSREIPKLFRERYARSMSESLRKEFGL